MTPFQHISLSTKVFASSCLVFAGCHGTDTGNAAADAAGALLVDTESPIVLVGTTNGPPAYAFHQVRGAVWISNHLLVADGASGEIRVFDEMGKSVRVFGRNGMGPGEHLALAGLWRSGDSTIVTHDFRAAKLSYWSMSGNLIHEITFPDLLPTLQVVGPINDSMFVGVRSVRQPDPPLGGTRQDSVAVAVMDTRMGSGREIGRYRWGTTISARTPRGGIINTTLPLYPTGSIAVGRSGYFVGHGDGWSFSKYSIDGKPLAAFDVGATRQALSNEIRDRWKAPLIARARGIQKREMEQYLGSLPYPTHLPSHDMLLVGDDETLWFRDFSLPDSDTSVWRIVRGAVTLALLTLPTALKPVQIGQDVLVGIYPTPDGVERVGVFRIRHTFQQQ